jgi:non-ribosomal peptide synthetase component F
LTLPPPFRNYIAWLRSQDEEKAEAFWRSELEGFRTATRLRIERERRTGENGHGDHRQIRFLLEREMTAKLEELARAHRVTLNAVIQGAWGILLSRYSGERDVVFGATVAGRSAGVPGIERMVGLFINTLPVRVRAADELTVPEYLKALQLRQVEARDVEYAPLVKVQSWSEIAPGSPLFESLVVFENFPVDTALQQQLADRITIDNVQLVNLSNYPLALRITPAKELIFDLIYRTQVYDDKSVERMVGHLRAVLEQMATQPDGEIGHISLLAKDEYRNLVDDWNQDESEFLDS